MHLIVNFIIFLLVFLVTLFVTKVLILIIDKKFGFFELCYKKINKSKKVKMYKIMSNITVSLFAGIICACRSDVNPYNLGIGLGILNGIIGAVFDER